MNPLEQVCRELRELGYEPTIVSLGGFGAGGLVAVDYEVATGRYRGRIFKVSIGFQEDAYPEYPPHFVGVANLPDPRIPVHSSHHYNNAVWSMFSVPPSDFWDNLPSSDKNMKTYVRRHLSRFWSQV